MANAIFGDFPKSFTDKSKSKIVIIPVPFDGTSTWMKGADKGPKAILDASFNLEFYDLETKTEVYKKGIYTEQPVVEKNVDKMVNSVHKKVYSLIEKDKFCVTIGGEHSISIGAITAHAKKFEKLSVLQLDAHSDMRSEYHNSKNNHACVMARAKEVATVVQVGIRASDTTELENIDQKNVFYAHEICDINSHDYKKNWVHDTVHKLSHNVYITIDLDVFDSSIMPSTGTPEPGGMSWYQVTNLLREVAKNKNIVGFDIVELCPNKNNKAPDFLAAKLLYQLLSYTFAYSKRDVSTIFGGGK
jgi:agmatinase